MNIEIYGLETPIHLQSHDERIEISKFEQLQKTKSLEKTSLDLK